MKNNYWIFVTSQLNWQTIKDKDIYGFGKKNHKDLEKINVGDYIVFYIKGKKLGGIFKIISLKSDEKIKFREGKYPYQIKLTKLKVPKYPFNVNEKIMKKISIFENAIRWGTILMGRSIKQIKEEDYKYLFKLLEKG